MEEKFIIQASLVQSIGEYLVKRPYHEVAQIVAALTLLQPAAPEVRLATEA
ncbi:hypothetical protein [Mesorhizobium sanjuanii]|uniref:hypothetical protein n=1 Tax=Mesorhizobium sanjuanii TaxID=2037900 RepID=UPI0013FDA954|nr:hypothetical protein [Mesorhizobium sanjuanii]